MMREILFRGKRIDDDEWVEGYLIHDEFCNTFIPYIGYLCGDGVDVVDVEPETVGQYTGLEDKNGKEIFEGDIIKFRKYRDEPDWVGVVSYEYCTYFAKGKMPLAYKKEIDKEAFHCPFEVTISGIDKATIEVIGNIHDNPELLEGV